MKKCLLILWAGVCLAAIGCKDKPKVPEQPEFTKMPEVTRLPPPINTVEPEDIDETNLVEKARKLEYEVNRDQGAMTKAGREGPPRRRTAE